MSGIEAPGDLTGVPAWQVKRVVMERDTYPRRWGLGPHSLQEEADEDRGGRRR